ncbi:CMRF35-like molecule 9 isoform X3 [Sciurus carolinensis]|uniref:CMRF35-like molecule 9 isoform X3 n=1 Tax=Sciurus carolinensis TaxID=30640 RepID=UPI001FB375D3|nr:CMRF35-like molecule 9 isoform X3 [Sciurus carolinensis]
MRPLVLLWSCLMLPGYEALKCPKEISGFEGDTVSLKCTYGEEQRKLKKYWCKETGIFISRCSSTIYSGKDGQEITKDRVSIRDSPQELAFTVTLRDLTLQDAGKYWCGAYRLGVDETSPVSLIVFPGPCCPPSPTLSLQPLATTRLQPKAKARQTQPPVLRSSRPPMPLDSTLAEDTSSVPSSHSSKSRVSIPMVRILAPVFVLLSLLLVTGLIAFGSFILRWRKKAQLTLETQKNEKVHLPTLPLEKSWVPEEAVINLSGPPEPLTSPESSAGPYKETQCLSQTTEEPEAPSQDPAESTIPVPALLMSEEELGFSKFVSV